MMLKTSKKIKASEMALFQKPRAIRNCQLPQDERKCNLPEKAAEKNRNRRARDEKGNG